MKLARYRAGGEVFLGRVEGDQLHPLLKDAGTGEDVLRTYMDNPGRGLDGTHSLSEVTLLAPLRAPSKILCIGLNYADHCRETNTPIPDHPIVFAKFPNGLAGPGDTVSFSGSLTSQVDYEVELAVIIGRRGRDIPEQDALGHVFGYTVANDLSARDLQMADTQWIRGKALDGFLPLGPMIVTAGDVPDPQALPLRCAVNGRLLQDSSTAEMIFKVAYLIHYLSQGLTLEAGDLILTGTPYGVGMARQPQVFLANGDLVRVEIEGIGAVENRIEVTP